MSVKVEKNATKQEIETVKSAYARIPLWVTEHKDVIDRKQKVDKDGNKVDKKPSLFPCVKAMLFNQSKLKGQKYEDLCSSVKYIVEDVMKISPATFYNTYDTNFMKQYKMYPGIQSLIEQTPPEIQKECCFNHKDIVFRNVWPEFYDKNLANSVTPHDILYATNKKKDMFKSNIIKAGKVDTIVKKAKEAEFGKGTKFGDLVDEMLFDAIKAELFVESKLCSTIPEAFYVLGELSKPAKKEEQNGGNDIAMSRGYKSILDFFYLNLPPEMQERFGIEYLDARERVNLESEPILEIAILAKLGEIEKLKSYGFLGVEYDDDLAM